MGRAANDTDHRARQTAPPSPLRPFEPVPCRLVPGPTLVAVVDAPGRRWRRLQSMAPARLARARRPARELTLELASVPSLRVVRPLRSSLGYTVSQGGHAFCHSPLGARSDLERSGVVLTVVWHPEKARTLRVSGRTPGVAAFRTDGASSGHQRRAGTSAARLPLTHGPLARRSVPRRRASRSRGSAPPRSGARSMGNPASSVAEDLRGSFGASSTRSPPSDQNMQSVTWGSSSSTSAAKSEPMSGASTKPPSTLPCMTIPL